MLALRSSNPLKTLAAVDWFVVARQEWYPVFLPTFGTGDDVHLSWYPLTMGPTHGQPALLAAVRAPSRLVEEPFLLVKLLLASAKNKLLATDSTF
jgi:hypothetical protein